MLRSFYINEHDDRDVFMLDHNRLTAYRHNYSVAKQ